MRRWQEAFKKGSALDSDDPLCERPALPAPQIFSTGARPGSRSGSQPNGVEEHLLATLVIRVARVAMEGAVAVAVPMLSQPKSGTSKLLGLVPWFGVLFQISLPQPRLT